MTGAEPLRHRLADGRELLLFALPGHTPSPVVDRRRLDAAGGTSELRFDRQTGQWIVIAPARQHRTYKPTPEMCPLCPGPTGETSEVPASDYDVAVFENRFPSLQAPGGRCEIVCFTAAHDGAFAALDHSHARLVVDVWRHRTAELSAIPGVRQVFCFENRGEEIGVTLTHPHGQIYAYPFLTPRTARMLQMADEHEKRSGANLFADILTDELQDGRRVVARNDTFTAFVPFAARWPVEVHIYPNRHVRNLIDLTDAELDGFTAIYLDVLVRFDRLYPTPLPYISALHQYTDQRGYFHVELMSIRRSADKLKYLAASESAMDAFISDVAPEAVARRLRELAT